MRAVIFAALAPVALWCASAGRADHPIENRPSLPTETNVFKGMEEVLKDLAGAVRSCNRIEIVFTVKFDPAVLVAVGLVAATVAAIVLLPRRREAA